MHGAQQEMVNSVVLVGRVGQDPEIRYFDSGSCKAKFSIAVDRTLSRENKITDWFNIEVWGKQAEFASEWIKKGALVSIQGAVELNKWTDQSGVEKEFYYVKASDIRFVGSKRDSQSFQQNNSGGGGASSEAVISF